jgi:hypothetical protein
MSFVQRAEKCRPDFDELSRAALKLWAAFEG